MGADQEGGRGLPVDYFAGVRVTSEKICERERAVRGGSRERLPSGFPAKIGKNFSEVNEAFFVSRWCSWAAFLPENWLSRETFWVLVGSEDGGAFLQEKTISVTPVSSRVR